MLAIRADQSHQLSRLLGDDHDLAVLTKFIKETKPHSTSSTEGDLLLGSAITQLRQDLQRSAQRLGRRLYGEKPKGLIRRVSCYWNTWTNYELDAPTQLQLAP